MANILQNISNHGLWEGAIETVKDIFGKGQYTEPATFTVTDANGEKREVSNSSSGPIYKTPTGYSSSRSYAYLTQGDNGKLTLNVSKDLYESDTFKKNYLDNSTFKEVLKNYNANQNASTVIPVTKSDGTTENMTFAQLVSNYNDALGEFATGYESYNSMRDNIKEYSGFDFTDDEIRIASNTIDTDDKKNGSRIIYLPEDWMSIYDFSKLDSFDADTKTVSAKDFFEAYDLDKDGGINEEAWNEMVGSANGIVANAYSGNMKKNLEESGNNSEEAIAAAKERLARAMQASNLLSQHDPEQSFLHSAGIVASNTLLTLGNGIVQEANNWATLWAAPLTQVEYWGDILAAYGRDLKMSWVQDSSTYGSILMGAAMEDIDDGTVTPYNINEYINGILVSSTDGSESEVERVKAEWRARVQSGDTLFQMTRDASTPGVQLNEATDWQIAYTSKIAPSAAQAGSFVGNAIYVAIEIWTANKIGGGVGEAITSLVPEAAAKGALAVVFGKGISLVDRLKALAVGGASFAANIGTQAIIDTVAFEDADTFTRAWALQDDEAKKKLATAFVDNAVGNAFAEIVGIGGSAIGSAVASSDNSAVKFVRARAIKGVAIASIPKKKVQLGVAKIANTRIGKFLNRPIGGGGRDAADFIIKAMNADPNSIIKAQSLEEWNVEKNIKELEATKNIAKAKKGQSIVTDFETLESKIAETTTEAILGKNMERTNLIVQANRWREGLETARKEIIDGDVSINYAWGNVVKGTDSLNQVLKWSEYNPGAQRFLSQESSNYLARKGQYDGLVRKQESLRLAGEELSASDARALDELSRWLSEFEAKYGVEAVAALNEFLPKLQAFYKATTDWNVKHGIMSIDQYERFAKTGEFGAEDQFYVRTIAMPNGKTMAEATEDELNALLKQEDESFANNTGYKTGVSETDNVYTFGEYHLKYDMNANYLDPVLVGGIHTADMAKAYQAKMWGNALTAIKAPVRKIDTDGKPMTNKEIKQTVSIAENSASEQMRKMAADDLADLSESDTLGKSYRDSKLETTRTDKKTGKQVKVNNIEAAQTAVNRKLGIATDKQIITNTNGLSLEQTNNVIATFGGDAPRYGKVRTNAELKTQFETLSEKQQEQALKAMGSSNNKVRFTETTKVKKANPEYAEWKKEKKAFEAEQKKAKKAYEKEQAKLAKQSTKKKSTKFPKEAKKQLEKDMRDAILYDSNTDIKSWKDLSTDEVNVKLTDARKQEVRDILKDDFDLDKFRELDNPKIEDALKPEYIEQVRAKYGGEIAGDAVEVSKAKTFEEKTFSKPAPEEFIYEKQKKVVERKVNSLDQPGALRAWNQAVDNTDMIEDLNKTFIRERVAPAEGGPEKMTAGTRETLEGYIAENSLRSWSPELMTEEELKDSFAKYQKLDAKAKSYDEAVKRLKDAKEMAKRVEEGTDPFTLATQNVAENAIGAGVGSLKNSKIGEDIAAKSAAYGFEDDSVYRYYTLSGMVEVKSDGTVGLSKKFENAFRERYDKRLKTSIRAEGDLTIGEIKSLKDSAVKKLNDYVVEQWIIAQRPLIEAGANDLLDANKMFDAIEGQMKQFMDNVKGNRNIVQILDAKGEYQFVEVDPVTADLYRTRPYVQRGDDNLMRKISRWARLGKVNLNLKSVTNQFFKDTIDSVIKAGLSHSVSTYSKELAAMYGEKFVAYLQESTSEAGWNKFTEGLTDEEIKARATEILTTGNLGAGSFVNKTTEKTLFQEGVTIGDYSKQMREITGEAYTQLGKKYKKSKGVAAGKDAKFSLVRFLEDYAPGSIANNWRELKLREANYTAAFTDAMKSGQTVQQARITAEMIARNATTDFQNTFMWGNWICDNVPFLSAAINGSASFWRLFEMDPLAVTTRIIAAGMAVVAQVISSSQSLEDRQKLQNIPDYVKRQGSPFIYGGQVYIIPLPEEVSAFLMPFRQAAEKMLGSEHRDWIELLYNDALNLSPIDLDGFSTEDQTAITKNEGIMSRLGREVQVLISQVFPPVAKAIIMGITKEDPYTGNPISDDNVYFDEEGNRIVMSYSEHEAAKVFAFFSKKFNWNISASMAEKLLENFFGTGGMQIADALAGLGETMLLDGKDVEGGELGLGEALLKTPRMVGESVASAIAVEDYKLKDQYDRDFSAMIAQLEKEKKDLLAIDGTYSDILNQMGRLDSTADNYETKKTNLTRQALQEIQDFRDKALNTVTAYVNHYGSDYDSKKFASVVALLNFDTPSVIPTSALDFQRASQQFYRGRQDAYQTMINMGFSSTNDLSIFGIAQRNQQTGEIYTKYFSPVAILNASNAVFNGMAEAVNAEVAADLSAAGIDRKQMFDGYYAAKAQGSAAAKQYKKDWNAKVVRAIAPTVYEYGASTVLENSVVQDYLDNYLFISNPWKTEDYLKEIFEVEDK